MNGKFGKHWVFLDDKIERFEGFKEISFCKQWWEFKRIYELWSNVKLVTRIEIET